MAGRETPATRAASAAGIEHALHEYVHDPSADSYALEAAEALGIDPARVFKTLVVTTTGGGGAAADALTVCIVPSAATLDLRAAGKRAAMAPTERAERVTGYVAGGISPLGPRRALPTLVDDSALDHATIFVSAGRRGLELELAPGDLVALTRARRTAPAPRLKLVGSLARTAPGEARPRTAIEGDVPVRRATACVLLLILALAAGCGSDSSKQDAAAAARARAQARQASG